ncbi:MAG: acetylxylan esterase [Kiritimatiellae bacterium]|nr:acetylxylan esterase [Kiritimatiellia bacterium]MDD5523206.1 acetylxylan esterase [Kiritimatiellia bacterium]
MINRYLVISSICLMFLPANAEDLTVLDAKSSTNAPSAMFENYLHAQAFAALDCRKEAYEKIKTPEQVQEYQAGLHKFFVDQLGGFPERTPLNGQVVGSLDGDGYRVEKIIYESESRHHVTALLYLPLGKPPFPGVLVPCGHSANGKGAETYQRASILLAKNGLAALCYDPISQGERAQILNAKEKAAFGCTTEHTMAGIGSILLGRNTARYRIWDGMRGIDYLQSRPDIDPKRIGCTGNSGGGTLTSYLMALDERIICAAPACYLTSWRRLLEKAGPQDGEQNIFGQIAFGMEHADYIIMRAPKPTLMCTATRDFFDIRGSWESFREAKRIFTRLGYADRINLVEADENHGFTNPLRVGAVRWMRRWLLGRDDEITESDFPIRKDEQIQCSPKGQVMLMPGERSVFAINVEFESQLAAKRRELWEKTPKADVLKKVREIVKVLDLDKLPQPNCRSVDTVQREGYRIEKLVIGPEPDIFLPALAFIPAKPDNSAYLYLHDKGKQTDAAIEGPIEQIVKKGHLVLAVDLRGFGETQHGGKKWYSGTFGPNTGHFQLAYLLGKSLISIWTEDILCCGRFLAGFKTDGATRKVHLVGIGDAGVPALHAAALEPQLFESLVLRRTRSSWADVVRTPAATNQISTIVHGALTTYDLPDLVKAVGPSKVTIEEPVATGIERIQ